MPKNKRIFILFGIPDELFGVILHIPLGICKKFGEVEKSTFETSLAFPARFYKFPQFLDIWKLPHIAKKKRSLAFP